MRMRRGPAATLAFSMSLRLGGTGFGLPAYTHYRPDEHARVERGITICRAVTGVLNASTIRHSLPTFWWGGLAASFLLRRAMGWWANMTADPLPRDFQVTRATTALSVINPTGGSMLFTGLRGTDKTTTVRGLVDLMPPIRHSLFPYGCEEKAAKRAEDRGILSASQAARKQESP